MPPAPLSAKTILVTGGGGFLGGAIVRLLGERGDRVRSFSRSRHAMLDALGVEQIQGDLADPEAVSLSCRGVELVFHTAAKAGVWGDPQAYHRVNVQGTRHILEACRRHGVKRLIYTSSPSVVFHGSDMAGVDESVPYPAHYEAAYPASKARAEQMVRAAGDRLGTICLRPHLIWGPGDNHLVPRIIARAGQLRRVGHGRNLVDTIYIDNAAQAHLLAAEKLAAFPDLSGKVYFISQDAPMPLWDMVDAILAAADLPPIRSGVSPRTAYCAGAFLEWWYRVFRLKGEPRMTRFVARELATSHWFDIRAAKKDLGFRPEVSTAEGLVRLRDWLRRGRPDPM
jgi:nucleoside-diphosphate-sugar epimerase